MKYLLCLIALLGIKNIVVAQSKPDSLYLFPEQLAKFSDYDYDFRAFMRENMRYPKSAVDSGIEGRVWVAFIVNKNGKLSDITILKPINHDLDSEALRVVKRMPRWKPALQNGTPVRSKFNVPIDFQLRYKEEEERQKISDPEFYGDMFDFVYGHMNFQLFPDSALAIPRTIEMSLIVDESGNFLTPAITRHTFPLLDSEVLRILRTMPKCKKPAIQNGKPIKVNFAFSCKFSAKDKNDWLDWMHYLTDEDPSLDMQPEFIAEGHAGLSKYFYANTRPKDDHGIVVVRFLVSDKGEVSDVSVLKPLSSAADKEAIRVIKKMPAWKPAMKDSTAVATYVKLPVYFNYFQNTGWGGSSPQSVMIGARAEFERYSKMQSRTIVYTGGQASVIYEH